MLALGSRTVRRVVVGAAIVDTAISVHAHHQNRGGLRLPFVLLAKRLDDLAYGAGLWWGAVRARSARVLLPTSPGRLRADPAKATTQVGPSSVNSKSSVRKPSAERGSKPEPQCSHPPRRRHR
jgi:hypothetical protein